MAWLDGCCGSGNYAASGGEKEYFLGEEWYLVERDVCIEHAVLDTAVISGLSGKSPQVL